MNKQNEDEYILTPNFIVMGFMIAFMIVMSGVGLMFLSQGETFTKEYTIATNYIDKGIYDYKITEVNYRYLIDYIDTEEYYYDEVAGYMDGDLIDYKSDLEHLEVSIINLKELKTPFYNSKFWNKEIELRIIHTELLIDLISKDIEIIDTTEEELYEINYGSELKAGQLHNDLISRFDEQELILEDYEEIINRIDIHWEENFYP